MTGTEARTPQHLPALLLAGYCAAGVAIAATALALPPIPPVENLAAAVLLIVASDRCGLSVSLGYSKMRVDWVEAAVLLGLVLLPPGWFVLVTFACLVGMEFARKTRL